MKLCATHCGRPAAPGYSRCEHHLELRRALCRKQSEQKKAAKAARRASPEYQAEIARKAEVRRKSDRERMALNRATDPESHRARKRRESVKYRDTRWAYQIANRYGITDIQYTEQLQLQGGCCAVCRSQQNDSRSTRLCVDHDHDTGAIRGLLCSNCNRAIGLLRDDPHTIHAAASYLDSHNGFFFKKSA